MAWFDRDPWPDPRLAGRAPVLPPDMDALLRLARAREAGPHDATLAWLEGEDDSLLRIRDTLRRDARRGALRAGPRRQSSQPRCHPAHGGWRRSVLPDDIADAAWDAGVARLCGSVIEPAARRLGDLWDRDDCTELHVTLELRRLLLALRAAVAAVHRDDPPLPPPRVLVAPAPGEAHMLTAALEAEILWQAGWATEADFPATDAALQAMVARRWFDVLALSLSPAFRREDSLHPLARSIAAARRASCNPGMIVIVGGRAFFDQAAVAAGVGADAASASAADVAALARAAIRNA